MSFTLNNTLAHAVEKQMCHVTVVFTSSGVDAWVRPTTVNAAIGVKPSLTMTIDEATEAYKGVIFKDKTKEEPLPTHDIVGGLKNLTIGSSSPTKASLREKIKIGKVHDEAPSVENFAALSIGLKARDGGLANSDTTNAMRMITASRARNSLIGRKLDKVVKNGVVNSLSPTGLSLGDFEDRNIMDLFIRMVVVADNLGGAALTGRVRSDNALRNEAASNLEEWWRMADGRMRVGLLSTRRTIDTSKVPGWAFTAVNALPCPFRSTSSTQDFFETKKASRDACSGTEEIEFYPGSGQESEAGREAY